MKAGQNATQLFLVVDKPSLSGFTQLTYDQGRHRRPAFDPNTHRYLNQVISGSNFGCELWTSTGIKS